MEIADSSQHESVNKTCDKASNHDTVQPRSQDEAQIYDWGYKFTKMKQEDSLYEINY